MSLTLYFHPLSSFCHKVLIALYENDTPFRPHLVDLSNETSRAEFLKIWPIGKFPVLRDDAKGRTVPESSIIIEYLSQHYPGRTQLLPADAELAQQRCACATASTTWTSTCPCRRSSATGCVRPAAKIRTASRMRNGGYTLRSA